MTEKKQNPSIERQIDDNLKRVYRTAAEEPLPDKFLSLIALLKAKEQVASDDS